MKKIITITALLVMGTFAFGQKVDIGSGAYLKQNAGSYFDIGGNFINNGTATIDQGASLTLSGNLTNSNTITLEPTAYMTVGGNLTNSSNFTVNSTSAGTGSLIISGTATNSGTFTFQRYLTEGVWHYISEPVNDTRNFNASSFLGLTGGSGNDQLYRWDESYTSGSNTGYWIDILNGSEYSSGSFQTAQGYAISYSGTGNTTIDFKGTPVTGDQSVSVTYTSASSYPGTNLVGNPFTSTLAVNSSAQTTNNFIDKNSSVLASGYQAVYLWDEQASYNGSRNDYVTVNNSSGAKYIEPGQAFMVIVASTASSLNFHSAIQKHGSASFYKSGKDDVTRFKIKVTNPEDVFNEATIAFIPGMTDGLDESYDARKFSGNPDLALYTRLVDDDGADYAIQSLPPPDDGVGVVLGLRAEIPGTYVFEPSLIENFSEDVTIKLEDKSTGIVTDLRKTPSYTFEVYETGVNNQRFVLHFNESVGIEENEQSAELQFYVCDNVLYINNDQMKDATLNVFNLLGQQIMTKHISGTTATVDLNMPTGYYIVNITTSNTSVNGKVFIR